MKTNLVVVFTLIFLVASCSTTKTELIKLYETGLPGLYHQISYPFQTGMKRGVLEIKCDGSFYLNSEHTSDMGGRISKVGSDYIEVSPNLLAIQYIVYPWPYEKNKAIINLDKRSSWGFFQILKFIADMATAVSGDATSSLRLQRTQRYHCSGHKLD